MGGRSKIVFIFLDGFGLGRAGAFNPIYSHAVFGDIAGQPLAEGVDVRSDGLVAKGIDACLGVAGVPQSATGQTALFTGTNAARFLGYHLPAFPCPSLRRQIRKSNLFLEALAAGRSATFANLYRREYFDLVASGQVQHSVTTVACLASGLPLRGTGAFRGAAGVSWDITGSHARMHSRQPAGEVSPEDAGAALACLASDHDLVVFECFLPDLIGHAKDPIRAGEFCRTLSRFVRAVIGGLDADTTLVLSSDHGNFEDLSTGSHTSNPVLLLALGPEARAFSGAASITDVAPCILSALGTRPAADPDGTESRATESRATLSAADHGPR